MVELTLALVEIGTASETGASSSDDIGSEDGLTRLVEMDEETGELRLVELTLAVVGLDSAEDGGVSSRTVISTILRLVETGTTMLT